MPSCILCPNHRCTEGCCCDCSLGRENCHECKNELCCNSYDFKKKIHKQFYTTKLFICFSCKLYQKKKEYINFIPPKDEYGWEYSGPTSRSICNKCHNQMKQIDSRVRVPKQKNKKEWVKLEKLIETIEKKNKVDPTKRKYIPYRYYGKSS